MRLTNKIRESVITQIIEQKIDPWVEEIRKEVQEIAQNEADNKYPEKVREWLKAAPKGGVSLIGSVTLFLSEDKSFGHELLASNRYTRAINLKRSIPVLACDTYFSRIPVSEKNDKRLIEILETLDNIEVNIQNTTSTLRSALWACNTLKQLEINYPELVKYLPVPTGTGKMLMVTNEHIKAILK